jgi:hypothetical protein
VEAILWSTAQLITWNNSTGSSVGALFIAHNGNYHQQKLDAHKTLEVRDVQTSNSDSLFARKASSIRSHFTIPTYQDPPSEQSSPEEGLLLAL